MAQRAIALVEEGRDVADHAVVVALAEEVDADRIALHDELAAGGGESRVAADQAEAARLGVTGVPFVVAHGLAVSGAQACSKSDARKAPNEPHEASIGDP